VVHSLPNPEKFLQKMRRLAQQLGMDPRSPGQPSLKACRDYLDESSRWILRYHRTGGSGLRIVHCRSIAIDVLIEYLYHRAEGQVEEKLGTSAGQVSLLALGGYGRSEMCPFSDVDIMFLYPRKVRSDDFPKIQQLINDAVLYPLWDLGLKVGHSTRNSKEALIEASGDIQSKNAMLEARLICGDKPLYDRFTREYDRFIRKDNVLNYLKERLADQKSRREKFGSNPFLQEPDIKSGVGGLRDFHNILWMTRLQYDGRDLGKLVQLNLLRQGERQDLARAYAFLLRVRTELHLQSNRATEVLDLEKQPHVANALGYRHTHVFARVEAFMRDYYRCAERIHQLADYLETRLSLNAQTSVTFSSVLQSRRMAPAERLDGFLIEEGILTAESSRVFQEDPVRLIRLFRHLQTRQLQLDFDLRRLIVENLDRITDKVVNSQEANTALRSILQNKGDVYTVLQMMNGTGVLSRMLPEWAGLHCLVQHEYYHRYTADQHVLHTVRELDAVFAGKEPELTRKYRKAAEETELPGLLYLILLLHDIGKARSIEGHAHIGAEMAAPILERLGVVQKARAKILFLIENHLEMARFWQRYDLDDPRTATAFAALMGNEEHLSYLYVLTFCDARGTRSDLWNSFKDSLHSQLYEVTLNHLRTPGNTPPPLPMISQSSILPKVPDLSQEEVEAHFNLLPDRYFSYHSEAEIVRHLQMIHELLCNISSAESVGALIPALHWENDLNLGLTTVQIVTWDRAGLFYKLAGAFALAGLSIVSSKALSRSDHISIDTFYVSDPNGGPVKEENALRSFKEHLEAALIHGHDLLDAIEAKSRQLRRPSFLTSNSELPAPIPPKVEVYHELSLKRTIIEIEANDEIGLLYRIARSIFTHGFDISFARISTERRVAVDTFYIEPNTASGTDVEPDLVALRSDLKLLIEGKGPPGDSTA
jgi:[protein-PII] uridylyltransferase